MTAASGVGGGGNQQKPPGSGRARFGVFELDVREQLLRRNGVLVKLQDQPLRLLQFLLENPGRVVTRDELHERLWPSEFVDFDHGLNTAIRKLRAALGDSAEEPRYVETLARRGYRFIAPVSWDTPPAEPAAALPAAPAPPPPQRLARWVLPAVAALAAVVAIVLGARAFRPASEPREIRSIAVLPFANDSAAEAHVSDGLTELLIDSLTRVPDLRVMARATVFDYKGKRIEPVRIGRELDVDALVTGQVRHEGDRQVIHLEVIDARNGAQLWGNRYESRIADLPFTQSRMAEDLSLHIGRKLDLDARKLVARQATRNPEAYQLYLRGLYLWNERKPDTLAAALDYFNRAIALDPKFADAYGGVANTLGVMVGYGLISPSAGAPRIMAAAEKALSIDPNNAAAYASLAATRFRTLWDFPGAERDFRRALELNPSFASARCWYGQYLDAMGRDAEAVQQTDLAYVLDPRSVPTRFAKCWRFSTRREYEKAIAFARTTANHDPKGFALYCAFDSLVAMGDWSGAVNLLSENPVAAPRYNAPAFREALARGGPRAVLEQRLAYLLTISDTDVQIAETYARLGQKDQAFAWLEKAFERHLTLVTSFPSYPGFDAIRDDPRFAALARRVGLPDAALAEATALAKARPDRGAVVQ